MMEGKRVLITGISGFVGSHLAEFFLERGLEVYGTIRWRSKLDNIKHIQDKVRLIETDIKDAHSMQKTIDEVEPDYVFHLAAQSFVPTSWKAPSETVSANILGTVNLFEAIRNSNSDPRIQVAGSSEEYGMVFPDEIPIKETNPLRPMSPYAVSKVATDLFGYQYHQSYGLKIVRTRAFNHTGPRRGEPFVTSNFAKQVAEIEKGLKEPVIHVGNLNAQRDFTDVRDIVNAYWLSVHKCKFGEVYNICSGVAREIQSVFDILQGMVDVQIEVKQDPERMRPSDVEILMCDCSKFRERTGWVPKIAFKDTMKDLLDYWRKLV
nr:putative NAD dependent epimerase/dehydratase [uncultured archaeon]